MSFGSTATKRWPKAVMIRMADPAACFFITRKLWDVGNSAPYAHRGDLTTITEAILIHGGEARASRDAFDGLFIEDRAALVSFLKTLQVLAEGSPSIVVQSD